MPSYEGQRTYAPRHQAGHMNATDQTVHRKKVLAMRPSTYFSQALTTERSKAPVNGRRR